MSETDLVIRGSLDSMRSHLSAQNGAPGKSWMERIEEHPSWGILSELRVSLRVVVALDRFKVEDLLALKQGQVIESVSSATDDVVVAVGAMKLGWSEFEVSGHRMAVRLTRLR